MPLRALESLRDALEASQTKTPPSRVIFSNYAINTVVLQVPGFKDVSSAFLCQL